MFEVYYGLPVDSSRESRIVELAKSFGGKQTCREGPGDKSDSKYVCLTFEFANLLDAEKASERLRQSGEHVEGIRDYG